MTSGDVYSGPDIRQVIAALSSDDSYRDLAVHPRWHAVRCPFHDDRHASGSYSVDLGSFRCHTCGAKGNGWTLIMQQKGMTFAEAREWARAANLGVEGGSVRPAVPKRYRSSWATEDD